MKNKHIGNHLLFVSPLETIWRAYKVSYGRHMDAAESPANMTAFILKWVKKGHVSPLKHSFLQMSCHSTVYIARQLAKHQIGMEWNEVSRRYTDINVEYYAPDDVELAPVMENCINAYRDALNRGVLKEQARAVLPLGLITRWVWGGSFLAWARVVQQRESPHAQAEAQEFVLDFLEELKQKDPNVYEIIRTCANVIK